jgi:tetratricopeptide (TPR) repeat protein
MQANSPTMLFRFLAILVLLVGAGIFLGRFLVKKFDPFGFSEKRIIPVVQNDQKSSAIHPSSTPKKDDASQNSGRDNFGYPLESANKIQVVELLRAGKYNDLTDLLEGYQERFEDDFRNELIVVGAFDAFSINDPSLQSRFDTWQQTTPNSYAPFLGRAKYFCNRAWENRGTAWAHETSSEQFAGMEKFFQLAEQDIAIAMKQNPNLLTAYELLISIARARGDEMKADRVAKDALDRMPESYYLRSAYMISLLPRWGGSYSTMEDFAEESEKLSSLNPRLKTLRGFIDWDKSRILASDSKFEEALRGLNRAMQNGENWRFLDTRARVLNNLNRHADALADLNDAVRLLPQDPDILLARARTLYRMNMMNEAFADFEMVERLDPLSSELKQSRERTAQEIVVAAYNLQKQKKIPDALALYDVALRVLPNHVEAYYYRAEAHAQMRSLDLAKKDLEKSMELDPKHYQSYVLMDWVLFQSRDLDKIISYWNRYIELEPNNAKAYLERGGTYFHKKDLKASTRDAKKACDLGNQEGCMRYKKLARANP